MWEYLFWILAAFFGYQGLLKLRGNPHVKHKIMKGARSFFYKTKGKKAALLIHGFTSTPQELKELGRFLKKRGISCYAPLLPGHGTHPEDMLNTTWLDWKECVLKAYKKLTNEYQEVIIIGSSLGGNLALLTAKECSPKAIITMGTPVFFRKYGLIKFLYLLRFIKKYQKKYYQKKDQKIVKKKVHYKVLPLKKISDVMIVTRLTRKILSQIKVPVLVMQSSSDYSLEDKNALHIYKRLGSKKKEIVWVPDSYHVFIMDENKDFAFRKICKFISSV